MNCEKCGKETGADWKKLCYSCYKASNPSSENSLWISCINNCGKKIFVSSSSKREIHRKWVDKLLVKFTVNSVQELVKVYKCRSCRKGVKLSVQPTQETS